MANRVEPHQRKKIIEALRRKNRTYAQLSREFSCSVSTIHRIAEAEGLTNRRARTSATEAVSKDDTYDKEKRVAVLDRILRSIDSQVGAGGQSTKQLLDLSRAAKEVSSARAAEDKLNPEPDPFEGKKDERGYVDIGMGDLRIHESDPVLEDMVKIHRGIDLWAERDAQEKAQRLQSSPPEDGAN